jgi:hypothetical protein
MRRPRSLFGALPHRAALGAAVAVVLVATATPAFDVMPALAAGAPAAVAGPQPSLTEFDVPGAVNAFSDTCFNAFLGVVECGTTPLANNDLGAVVGTYTDASFVQHAFLRAPNGYITTIDAPGAGAQPGQGTVAFAINDAGVIAGVFADSNNVFHGFLRFPNGFYQQIDAPGAGTSAGQGTLAFNVNPSGATAGIYLDATGVYHGFVRTLGNRFASFDPPGSAHTYTCEETCLTLGGSATGAFFDSAGTEHAFLRTPDGNITTIDVPGSLGTGAASINPQGIIAGTDFVLSGSSFVAQGFTRARDGAFTTFVDPGASMSGPGPNGVNAYSINLVGEVTGIYFDASGVQHGFERDANGNFTNFDAPGAGTAPFNPNTGQYQGTRPSTNNAWGEVTGWYIDANYVSHGFVWQP